MPPSTMLEPGLRGGVTLQDVARHLGVHPMTVSRALSGNGRISESTKASVKRAADELGYRPNVAARTLRRGHNPGQVALFAGYLDSGKNTQKLEAIQNLLGAEGFETPIHSCGFYNQTSSLQTEMLAGLRTQRPAAIVCNTLLQTPGALEELHGWISEGGTTVVYDNDLDIACDRVVFDREDAGWQAAKHLLDLGHRRIGYAHHSPVHNGDTRLEGVERALREAGLNFPAHWVLRAEEPNNPVAGGYVLAAQFLALPPQDRPTALTMVNDLAAMAFIAELNRHGISVPGDLSIVAHDDQPFAEFAAVPLTAVTHPANEIAREVVNLVLERLRNRPVAAPRRVLVQGQLITRASARAI